MPETSSREGFTLRLYLNNTDTSIYSYDLGWVNSPARPQGFQLSPAKMTSGLATVREWWGHVLTREPNAVVPVQESPLKSEITLLVTGPDTGKLECRLEVSQLEVVWLWDPRTDVISTAARAAFQMSPAGFDWYLNAYAVYLDAIQRIRESAS